MYYNKEYVFKGKHAKYVKELKDVLFDRNVDVFLLAPIVGMAYNRRSSIDVVNEYANTETTKIFADVMINTSNKNIFNFRLCVLTSPEFSEEEKKNIAFKYYAGDDEEYKDLLDKALKIYNSYILGGVEILYEDMLQGNKNYNGKPDDIKFQIDMIKHIAEFIGNYEETADEINSLVEGLL